MKSRLLILFSLLVTNNMLVSAQDKHQDTVPHTIIIPIPKGLVLPESKNPDLFCKDLKTAWISYCNGHKELVAEFVSKSDSSKYVAAFVVDISKAGRVSSFKKLKQFTKIEGICYDALNKVVKASVWYPAYLKNNGRQSLDTRGTLYMSIKGKSLTVWISSDENGIQFFECSINDV